MKKPFIEVSKDGHIIAIMNTANKCSLFIDGCEVDAYKGAIAFSFTLNGSVGQNVVKADFALKFFGGVMKLYYNGELLAKKYHL